LTAATAIIGGLLAGYLVRDLRRAYLIWGVIWVLVLIGQTILLGTTEDDALGWSYVPVQVGIFAAGVVAVWIASNVRRRREGRTA
jgi:4-amino-4-deoxy-L-arabinose transferase-like glycosyltransferase